MSQAKYDLSPKEYIKQFRNAIYDNFESAVNLHKGHTEELHCAQGDHQLINRLLHDNVINASSFYDYATMEDALQNALFYDAAQIATWIQSEPIDFANNDAYWTLVLTVNVGDDEAIGHGFDNNFKEIESPDITIVLQRDNSNENYYGFYLKSAYVDLTTEHAEYTGIAYTKDEITHLDGVVFESKIEELVFKNQGLFTDIAVRYKPDRDHQDTIIMEQISADQQSKTLAYLKENGEYNIKQTHINSPMTRCSIHEIDPHFADAINNMQLQIKHLNHIYDYNHEH